MAEHKFEGLTVKIEVLGERCVLVNDVLSYGMGYDVRLDDVSSDVGYLVRIVCERDKTAGEIKDYALSRLLDCLDDYKANLYGAPKTIWWSDGEGEYLRGLGEFAVQLRHLRKEIGEVSRKIVHANNVHSRVWEAIESLEGRMRRLEVADE